MASFLSHTSLAMSNSGSSFCSIDLWTPEKKVYTRLSGFGGEYGREHMGNRVDLWGELWLLLGSGLPYFSSWICSLMEAISLRCCSKKWQRDVPGRHISNCMVCILCSNARISPVCWVDVCSILFSIASTLPTSLPCELATLLMDCPRLDNAFFGT